MRGALALGAPTPRRSAPIEVALLARVRAAAERISARLAGTSHE
jgi:DNA-binding IclR family transcriptional regulator